MTSLVLNNWALYDNCPVDLSSSPFGIINGESDLGFPYVVGLAEIRLVWPEKT